MSTISPAIRHPEIVVPEFDKDTHGGTPHLAPKHQNNFSFIRHLLAIFVVLQHALYLADGNLYREPLFRVFHAFGIGTVSVFGFFVLSGYLITQSWVRNPKPLPYLQSRILRIYPGFLVAAFATISFSGALEPKIRATLVSSNHSRLSSVSPLSRSPDAFRRFWIFRYREC